ncbi:MAG: PIN domain-containing protein [Bacteroidetes bacterium]|nr:MAG: PIN domain-containing protein [Bacteroidota bacterium]
MNKIFLDTNLLIYLSTSHTSKAEKVSDLINKTHFCFISVQILNEFAAACFKKELLSFDQIQKYIWEYNLCFEVADVNFRNISECFLLKKKYKYSWFDSLIIATALLNGCQTLYSEDLQHKQVIENKLTILNPFV